MSVPKRLFAIVVLLVIGASILLVGSAAARQTAGEPQPQDALPLQAGAPSLVNYQGRLTDASGNPRNGSHSMTFGIYSAATGGSALSGCSYVTTTSVISGLFNVRLPFGASCFSATDRWLQVEVGGETLAPRQRIAAVPYAIEAEEAKNANTLEGNGAAAFAMSTHDHDASYVNVGGDEMTGHLRVYTESGYYGIEATGANTGVRGDGATYGVHGDAYPSGSGVYGTGNTGVYGYGDTYGVRAVGGTYGVYAYGEYYGGYFYSDQSGWPTLRVEHYGSGSNIIEAASGSTDIEFRVTTSGEVYADGTFHQEGADFAEMMVAEGNSAAYELGDVLVISAAADETVAKSSSPYSSAVIGVYSAKPGFLGGSGDGNDAGKIAVAMIGVVPVKVSAENGPIQRGDLLTTSSTIGHAMKATESRPGTILGKALQPLPSGTGVITAIVGLR